MSRKRQIKMMPVSTAISAVGGYMAQFADQEAAKDAMEFVPSILKNAGIRLDEAIFSKFCQRVFERMVEHTAVTGDWVTWSKIMTSRLYVLGRFESKDAKVPPENVEQIVIPLEGFRLDLTGWSIQNVVEGNELKLTTISDQGGDVIGIVTGTKPIEIHGVNCPIDTAKEDEGVWLSAKAKTGEEIVERKLTVTGSDVKTVVVENPGAALLAPYTEASFEVRCRAGNEDGELQRKPIKATVKAVEPPPDDHAVLTDLRTSAEDTPSELSIDDGLTLTFDKADPEGRTGHLVVNGVEQSAPVTVDQAMTMVMWTFGREELIGQEVTFNFRYEDGTEVGEVKKTIREER